MGGQIIDGMGEQGSLLVDGGEGRRRAARTARHGWLPHRLSIAPGDARSRIAEPLEQGVGEVHLPVEGAAHRVRKKGGFEQPHRLRSVGEEHEPGFRAERTELLDLARDDAVGQRRLVLRNPVSALFPIVDQNDRRFIAQLSIRGVKAPRMPSSRSSAEGYA